MKSDITSSIIYHEISKTIDPGFQLRGQDYPLGGIYKIWGGPKTLGSKRPYISLAFSPNGALDAVNKNFISQAILRSKGEVKMVQFAFSSGTINEALLKRAENEIAKKGKFVFQSVGDTPFAMQDWSVFLKMSGIDLIRSKSKSVPVKYVEIKNSEWKKLMGQEGLNELRQQIRVAPEVYGTHQVDINGIKSQVTSKIHHKVLITGENQSRIAITGSFNFSAGAENNQEFILLIKDERITKELNGAIDYLHQESRGSVFEEALARNKSRNFESAIKPDEAVKGIRPSMLHLKKAPVPCNSLGSQLKFLETLR